MNILIFSASDITHASGIIAYDLMKALNQHKNVKAKIVVRWSKHKNEKNVISYLNNFEFYSYNVLNKIKKKLSLKIKTDKNYYFFDINQTNNNLNITRLIKRINFTPDVIIGYFQGNFFKLIDLYLLQKEFNAPVLLVMADRVYLTGGCHYFWDCEGYKNSCHNCPAILDKKNKHFAEDNLFFFKRLTAKMNVSLIALSQQDYIYAKKSVLYKNKNAYKVLGGIDLSVFFPHKNRKTLRSIYNINEDDFVLLYGAVNINEKRKGFRYFFRTIKKIDRKSFKRNIVIITIGGGGINSYISEFGFKHIHMGYISDYKKLAEVYNVSDLLLNTSIQDSGPMMINQSIACGTPVVCFDVGVAQDIVINGLTGYKTEIYNVDGLLNGVTLIAGLPRNEYHALRKNCYLKAKNEFSKEIAAENFTRIINTII